MEGSQYVPEWTFRTSVRRHPRAWLIALLAVLAMTATVAVSIAFASHTGVLSDATPCSDWAVSTAAQQKAYAQLYLTEYGIITPAGSTPAAVTATLNARCSQAALLAEATDVSLIAAVHRRY